MEELLANLMGEVVNKMGEVVNKMVEATANVAEVMSGHRTKFA